MDNGIWVLDFCYQSENAIIICAKHTDIRDIITYVVEMLGMYSNFINMK